MVRIQEIQAGSIADELEIEIGTRVVRINGEHVRDGLDFTFKVADHELELETVAPDGEESTYEVRREAGQELGIVPAPDKIRECANECVFCFIDGNPEDVRESLWLRDDDFRLSFTYGSYVTLTNLGPRGLQRLVEQRISPLYVSVHATEPEVRVRLLKNERAGLILDQLEYLLNNGLELHAQVVLCPGWNDGEHLDRTIEDLWSLGDGVRSLSVVPVGLTRYNLNRPVRPMTPEEGRRALDQVHEARTRARRERGHAWCYAADELFLLTDREIPPAEYYDAWELDENGVGSVRTFVDRFDRGLESVPELPDARLRLVTGSSMAPFLRERAEPLSRATGARVQVVEVTNHFYGETVTVAGLLAGRDIRSALGGAEEGDLVLLPENAVNADDLFIDSLPLDELRRSLEPARVILGDEVTAALRRL